MKKILALVVLALLCLNETGATGILIKNAANEEYLDLVYDSSWVTIHDQIVQVKTRQKYHNQFSNVYDPRFGFPLNEGASPIDLRWHINDTWYEADFSAQPQDTIMPGEGGGNENFSLNAFMGSNPFYFTFANPIAAGEDIVIELTYVFMMPYQLGVSNFIYPLDHSALGYFEYTNFFMSVDLYTQREIIEMISSMTEQNIFSSTDHTYFEISQNNLSLSDNYQLDIEFSSDDLGIFSYSTYTTAFEEAGCDTISRGFLGLIVEPALNEDIVVMPKVFSLVIDRSGSMDGIKMQQAKEAASFIVNNLNAGDMFNIVYFSTGVNSVFPDHVPYTTANKNTALNAIAALYASGSTNIYGALSTGISQYSGADQSTAHIMIFFTDGLANSDYSTASILNMVQTQKAMYSPDLTLFSFGIGDYINEQLLNLLAIENNGLYTNVANNQVSQVISEFYLLIQNPVLLNPQITFDPPMVFEVYPQPLQNLYLGQQLRVFGRYPHADTVSMTLSGDAFGMPVEYNYEIVLSGEETPEYHFISRMWADQKIKSLQNLYYQSFDAAEQAEIQEDIIGVSLCYGVISDFTSFEDNTGGSVYIEEEEELIDNDFAYPNPFTDELKLDLKNFSKGERVRIEIYNSTGQLIYFLEMTVGDTYIMLNENELGQLLAGTYLCRIVGERSDISQMLVKR
ncbi:MAG: hypothetical protein RL220_825 [Bacteroidota bacterium]